MNALAELPPAAVFSPGIHHGLPFAEYLAIEALSSSGAKSLLQSPAHFMHHRCAARTPTAAMRFGTAVHLGVLEPDRFDLEVIEAPTFDRRTKAGKAEAAAWEALYADRLAFEPETLDAIRATVEAVRAHPAAGELFTNGRAEVTAQWIDAAFGVPCKARFDFWRRDELAVDLKTTDDASPEAVSRTIARHRYHLQAAHYSSGAQHVFGRAPAAWVLVFAERDPPHAVACYQLAAEAIQAGAALCAEAMERYRDCTESGHWPSYSPFIEPITLPRWAF